MGVTRSQSVPVESIDDYADRIDVRTPAEFAEDHLPQATNHPVLDDGQRAHIGTLYARDSFAAKRTGAALVARNIAHWIETAFADRPRDWRPLVYCWRGGKRSGAMAHVLNEIGWKAVQLEGGYRAFRRRVVTDLETLPSRLRFVVVCGLTGSGKSRLLSALEALGDSGAQVLDLEAIARHRGSLLGELPSAEQPSQKSFETGVRERLRAFDPTWPVFVESESRKIGNLQVPDALIRAMRDSECIRLETAPPMRVALLKDEYRHFLDDPQPLCERLRVLVTVHGRERIAKWEAMAKAGDWDALVSELLEHHYDPTYERSMVRNYARYAGASVVAPGGVERSDFTAVARHLLGIAPGIGGAVPVRDVEEGAVGIARRIGR